MTIIAIINIILLTLYIRSLIKSERSFKKLTALKDEFDRLRKESPMDLEKISNVVDEYMTVSKS